jgi:hypothetical protein
MTTDHINDIQVGWKVFAGSEEVGAVNSVGDAVLEVRRGGVIHQRSFRIPASLIAEASDGVVDVTVDPSELDRLEVTPAEDSGPLPEESRRLEMHEHEADGGDVPDEPHFAR